MNRNRINSSRFLNSISMPRASSFWRIKPVFGRFSAASAITRHSAETVYTTYLRSPSASSTLPNSIATTANDSPPAMRTGPKRRPFSTSEAKMMESPIG